MIKNKLLKRKLQNDLISRIVILGLSLLSMIALLTMFSFIIKEAIPAYKKFGLFHMYFTSDFTQQGGYGIWGALTLTLVTSLIAIAIALPISLRTAIFMKYRMKNREKPIKVLINISAGIPSVVFGIFALKSLNGVSAIFGVTGVHTILNASLMLTIMVFPTLVSLIYNQLSLVNPSLMSSSMAMGETKTAAIYKVVKKSIKTQVYVAVIVALGRAIGETMALSMVLTSPAHPLPFTGDLNNFFSAPFSTLGVEIARQMFNDGSNPETRSALFAAGLAIFIIIMIFISVITKLSEKRKLTKNNPFDYKSILNANYTYEFIKYLILLWHSLLLPIKVVVWVWNKASIQIEKLFEVIGRYLTVPLSWLLFEKKGEKQNHNKYFSSNKRSKKMLIPVIYRMTMEWISVFLVVGSISWIILSVLIYGLPQIRSEDWSFQHKNSFGKVVGGDIMNPLIWTILLISITIIISIPFALAGALYLSEYARNKKSGKMIKFFLDSLGGTPSILFGIFGAVFFLRTLGMAKLSGGTSLIAGSLTMVLVILPTFTRSIEQILIKIPDSMRYASYALGASKFETIRKIIVPNSIKGISTGIVLSSGRIISETAPIYLTLGMFNGINIGFYEAGHTLTTDILFNQVFSAGNAEHLLLQSYKLASIAIILITMITLFTELINMKERGKPNVTNIKKLFSQRLKLMIPKRFKASA